MSVSRYAAWDARDYILHRFPLSLLLCSLVLVPFAMRTSLRPEDVARILEQDLFPICALALVAFAVHGIVGADRSTGLDRLLFTRPISNVSFYLQRFAIHGVLTVLGATLVSIVCTVWITDRVIWSMPLFAGTAYLLLGGVAFLTSEIVRVDSIAVFIIWFGVYIIDVKADEGNTVLERILYVLPPVPLLDVLTGKSAEESVVTAVLWCGGYGLAAVAAGVLWLRRGMGTA